MNKLASFNFLAATLLVITLSSAGTAAAQNTKFGTGALSMNTTGTDNTALGFGALFENTTASNNTATGANALGANIGENNTAREGLTSLQPAPCYFQCQQRKDGSAGR